MTARNRTLLPSLAGLLVASVVFAGCNGSSSKLVPQDSSDASNAQATTANGQTSVALGSLALQAALNQVDPANFPAVTAPPAVSATGGATSGTVTLDFGSGVTVNNATIAGTLDASYTVSGSTVSITVNFGSVSATTTAAGTVDLTGSLTISATLSGATATGSIGGTVTATSPSDTTTVNPNLTYSLDALAGRVLLNGTMGLASSLYDTWTATITNLGAAINLANRVIDAGTIRLNNNTLGSLVEATFLFTGANTGTLTISPSGYSQTFVL